MAYPDLSKSSTLLWALVGSMLLHVLLAYFVPNISFDAIKKPDLLKIELVKKEAPPPAPQPQITPEPPPPEPVKPKIVEPKPLKQLKPLPVQETPLKTPAPIAEPQSVPPPPTEVIAVAPKPEAPPSPVPPAPIVVPPPPPGPSEADLDDARNSYGRALWGAIEKHKQYPKIAQMRGWQGEAVVELLLDGNGKLKSKKILSSSGHDVLDKQALEMVEKAAPYPVPPEVLRGSQFSIKVPVPFKLQD